MSIQTEIERLENAKESIKTELGSKGVTVPDDAKLDEYGNLVASIMIPDVDGAINDHNLSDISHSDIRNALSNTVTPERLISATTTSYNATIAYIDSLVKSYNNPLQLYINSSDISETQPTGVGQRITTTLTTDERLIFERELVIPSDTVIDKNIYWLRLPFESISSSRLTYIRPVWTVVSADLNEKIIFDSERLLENTSSNYEFFEMFWRQYPTTFTAVAGEKVVLRVYGRVNTGTDSISVMLGDSENPAMLLRNVTSANITAKSIAYKETNQFDFNEKIDSNLLELDSHITEVESKLTPTMSTTSGILDANKIYRIIINSPITFKLPVDVDNSRLNQIMIQVTIIGSPAITWGTTEFFGGEIPEIKDGKYNIYYEHDGQNWVCGTLLKKGI